MNGGTSGSQMIVAAAVRLIVHELRIGADAADGPVAVLQLPVSGAVLVDEVVQVLIVDSGIAVFLNAISRCAALKPIPIDDVVAHHRAIVDYSRRKTAGIVTVADQYSAIGVIEDRIVRNGHFGRRVPQMDAPTLTPVHQIVPNVTTQVGMVDPVMELMGPAKVPNVMDYIADDIIVVPGSVIVVDDSAAEHTPYSVISHIMDVVANDAHI